MNINFRHSHLPVRQNERLLGAHAEQQFLGLEWWHGCEHGFLSFRLEIPHDKPGPHVFLLSLAQALKLDEGRKTVLVDLAAVSLLLSSLFFVHLDVQTCFPLCPDH